MKKGRRVAHSTSKRLQRKKREDDNNLSVDRKTRTKLQGNERVKVFLSYHFPDEDFVRYVDYYLRAQAELETFFYPDKRNTDEWPKLVERGLRECSTFVFVLGRRLGETQAGEALKAIRKRGLNLLAVRLPRGRQLRGLSTDFSRFYGLDPIVVSGVANEDTAYNCAKEVAERLGLFWQPGFGVPSDYVFEYEKDIIRAYIRHGGELSSDLISKGCPKRWPNVPKREANRENPTGPETIGGYRDWDEEAECKRDPQVVVAALAECLQPEGERCLVSPTLGLTFPEAGPRRFHYYPKSENNSLTVGILVSGGIAPGINAVISGISERHVLYAEELRRRTGVAHLEIVCYHEGFKSLARRGRGQGPNHERFSLVEGQNMERVSKQAHRGGSVIPTARAAELMEMNDMATRRQAIENVVDCVNLDGVEILYVIGGDGSMKAAHAIHNCAKNKALDLSVVAIPKTMDNDILWVWQSFGFLSAVEWAKEAIRHLNTEVMSNPRVCVIQLFGSDSGFVVCHAALASGVCDLVLIPEVEFEIPVLIEYLVDKLSRRFQRGVDGKSPYGIVLMAETAIPRSVEDHLNDEDFELTPQEKEAVLTFVRNARRVQGQTPDALREAGLKIVKGIIKRAIHEMEKRDPYWNDFRVFANQPRHLIRAIPPSASDIIFGGRLGMLAVDCAMAGYHDFMISQWLTEYVMAPLRLVILGRKRVPREGIFWKTVLASTGQPASMVRAP